MAKCIFFDLDGTLTDSGEGIMNCVEKTLHHYGITPPPRQDMRFFVGPPLRTSFPKFGIPQDRVEEAIRIYRQFYVPEGMFQNTPYPGIAELLQRLKNDGCRLFVATSKPEAMSAAILEKFGLAPYFERICGSLADGIRDSKAEVIAWLLEQCPDIREPVMVGDTVFDIRGAAAHQIPAIGVAWGYGRPEDMKAAGAADIAHSMDELYRLLQE